MQTSSIVLVIYCMHCDQIIKTTHSTYICKYVCMYVCVYMYVCMYVCMCTCMHVCMHVHTYTCKQNICMYCHQPTYLWIHISFFSSVVMYIVTSIVTTQHIYKCLYHICMHVAMVLLNYIYTPVIVILTIRTHQYSPGQTTMQMQPWLITAIIKTIAHNS